MPRCRSSRQLPDPLPSGLQESGLNFLHLWFVYVLLWLYGLVIALRSVWQALDTRGVLTASADRTLRTLLASRAGVLLLAAPVAVALALIPDWNIWLGVPTPGYTLLPPAVPLFIFACVSAWAGCSIANGSCSTTWRDTGASTSCSAWWEPLCVCRPPAQACKPSALASCCTQPPMASH